MYIEPLEPRIAPANLLFVNDKTVSWKDSDGDQVTLIISKGTLDESNFAHIDSGAGLLVTSLDLTASEFAGTSITVTAKRGTLDGNSTVDVGYINAAGNALGSVAIDGDLGRIDAGPGLLSTKTSVAIKSLKAASIGTRPDLLIGVLPASEINGGIGTFTVAGAVSGAVHVSGGSFGSIGTLNIGALLGGDVADSGRIDVTGNITSVTIRGNVQGGEGQHSGSLEAGMALGKVLITGSLLGGQSEDPTTDGTGVIRAGSNMAGITIKGSVFGGTQQESGLIDAGGNIATVAISGSVYGGSAGLDNGGIRAGSLGTVVIKGDLRGSTAEHSGFIQADKTTSVSLANLFGGDASNSGVLDLGVAGSIAITGDFVGGNVSSTASANLVNSGTILADNVSKIAIGGSIRTGADANNLFDLVNNAAIRVANALGSIVVKGEMLGTAETHVLITARGSTVVQAGADVAIGRATFGRVTFADVLAGYDTAADLTASIVNPDAQVGVVTVHGSWTASNLVAGAKYSFAFGDGSDVTGSGSNNPGVNSRIAAIVIDGAISGTSATGDHYGFVAQSIGSLAFGNRGAKLALNAGAFNDSDPTALRYSLSNTGDVRLFELAS